MLKLRSLEQQTATAEFCAYQPVADRRQRSSTRSSERREVVRRILQPLFQFDGELIHQARPA